MIRADPPIYICASGEEFLEPSGEIGDGSLPIVTPPESASLMVDRVHRGARRVGRYLLARERIVQADPAEARRAVSEEMLRRGIAGTPEQCVEPIGAMVDAGLTQFVHGGDPGPAEAIRLLGERVLTARR